VLRRWLGIHPEVSQDCLNHLLQYDGIDDLHNRRLVA
jgi:hypothetical protein